MHAFSEVQFMLDDSDARKTKQNKQQQQKTANNGKHFGLLFTLASKSSHAKVQVLYFLVSPLTLQQVPSDLLRLLHQSPNAPTSPK